ncbi:MAG TPA: hypothetical protein VGD21_02060 [Lysobacter sp.]
MDSTGFDKHLVAQAQQLLHRGRVDLALDQLSPALTSAALMPNSLKLLARLALREQRMPLAGQALQRVLQETPDDAEAHALMAASAKLTGDPELLERAARRALSLDHAQPLATALLVEHLRDGLRLTEALQLASRCLKQHPDDWGTRLARADLWQFAGEADAAEADALRAAQVSNSLQAKQSACMNMLYRDEPSAEQVLERHVRLGAAIPPIKMPLRPRTPYRPGLRPLRVGLLSADLRRHPVGTFVEPLLSAWDRQRIVPVCYSDATADATTARLRGYCAEWHDVRGEPDVRVMQRVQDDAIDVLIDLGGHTFGSRPQLLSSRCAPLQLTYLGYLFDTGLAGCDGVIGDAATLPEGSRSARRPLRLPGSFLCHLPSAQAPPVVERAADIAPTFGSFNHLAKLSPQTVALWSRVLNAVPHSRLVLCALGLADAGVRDRVRARFAAQGLDPGRLELRPPNTDPTGFLAQYADIDIALDPLPFNGGTTTLQALWQGVPVITCPGERMAARSGLSILGAAGLSQLIARDHDQFVAIACALGRDLVARQELRQTLRQRLVDAGMTDARRFAEGFAALLEATVARS